MKKLFIRHIIGIICILSLSHSPLTTDAQIHPPGMKWYNGYFEDENFCNDEISQAESGEDWFFDVNKSKDNLGVFNGFICCGYLSKQCNLNNPLPCQPLCGTSPSYEDLRDHDGTIDLGLNKKGTVWFIDKRGHAQWYIQIGEGYESIELRKILQTNDGNYVAVGQCAHSDIPSYTYTPATPIPYNPGFTALSLAEGDGGKGFVLKIDATTHQIIWMNCYALDLTNKSDGAFTDVIEDANFDLFVSGRCVSGSTEKGTIAKIDPSTGDLIWIKPVDHSNWTTTFTEFNSLVLAPDGTITAGGACAKSGETFRYGGTHGFIANITPGVGGITVNKTTLLGTIPTGTTDVNFVFDIDYINNDDLIVPCVEQCADCPFYSGRPQKVIIYRYKKTGADPFDYINQDASLGGVEAFDMQTGIERTCDGGFIFMSTKRTSTPPEPTITLSTGAATTQNFVFGNPWPFNNLTSTATFADHRNWFWNTDAYVAKYDASLNLEWKNTYPFSKYDNTVTIRGDIKQQECLYKIIQLDDGSFAGCGNNSANFDDHVLFNLNNDCQNRYSSYDIGNTFTPTSYDYPISTNTTWSSNKKIKGTVKVQNNATLTINNNAVIEFADTRQTNIPTTIIVEKGGKLILKGGAKLTSLSISGTGCSVCPNSVWDGVQVQGDMNANQSPISNQGFLSIDNATIENARIGVRLSASDYVGESNWYFPVYDKTGGVIQTHEATFKDNWKHIEFMKYNSPAGLPNISKFEKTDFLYTGAFPDPDIFYDGNGYYSGYGDFVSMWDVQGVQFLGCNFENTTSDAIRHKGRGIYSIDATYTVGNFYDCLSLPCTNIIHSSFVNVREGIKALMYSPVNGPTLKVDDADFVNVRQGIGISGFTLPYPQITSNRISLYTGDNLFVDQDDAWGIHATGCSDYTIEENSITSDIDPDDMVVEREVIGIAVNNRHVFNTMVYKNTIEKMLTSILPFGECGATGTDIGLLVKCNQQTVNHYYDDEVRADGVVPGSIKDEQGGCNVSFDPFLTPAGNTLTDVTGGAVTVHLSSDAFSNGFNYHFRGAIFDETPTVYSINVNPVSCNKSYTNLCPTRLNPGWGGTTNFPALIGAATTPTAKGLLEKEFYNFAFDSNNVTAVITYIAGKTTKTKNDSLTWSHAYTAIADYSNAQAILATMDSTDNLIIFLKKLNTELNNGTIIYNTNTAYADSLKPLVLDSTKLSSIYAENVLRVTNLFQYPFRIPDPTTSSKMGSQIVRKSFEDGLPNFIVFPNPNNGKFTVVLDANAYKSGKYICVTDVMGRRLYTMNIEKDAYSYTLDIYAAPGIYFVQVLNESKSAIETKRITIK